MPSVYIPNPGFAKELMDESPGFLEAAGQEIAAEANNNVERIMPQPGKAEAIEVVVEGGQVSVVNVDYGGHLDEWGSKNNSANGTLRRAVSALGYRFISK